MKIEIWSDIICPFCYIGLTKLELALQESTSKPSAKIIWKSYQLNPDYPEDAPAMPTYDYLVQTKGMSMDDVVAMTSQLSAQGKELGIDLNFEYKKSTSSDTFCPSATKRHSDQESLI